MTPTPLLPALFCMLSLLFAAPTATAAVRVAVSVLPLAGFAERVGGDRVSVSSLVGPGQNPHSFEPTARQIEELTSAELFWRAGMPFEEAWIDRLRSQNHGLAVLDARAALESPPAAAPAAFGAGSEHGDGNGHDPHVWTSPVVVQAMVRRLAEALAALDPAGAAVYRANAATCVAELQALDAELRRTLAPLKDRRFLVYHPAWGEFAATYGLEQIPIERDGKEPGARSLAELATLARQANIRVVFVQPQSSPRSAQTLAREIGARVVTVDPLARDYAATLRALAQALVEASS